METIESKPRTTKTTGYSAENSIFFSTGITGWRVSVHQHIWAPPTDVYENEENYVVRVELAGMNEDDFVVKIDQNKLMISGIRPDLPETRAFHQMEIRFGEFSTEVDLPGPVVMEHVSADYSNGFLRVILPKTHSKHITIEG
jgi:HSP20 family protein